MTIIDINKDLCPYKFDIQLDGTTYTMEVRYSAEYDFFTIDLSIGETVILTGEKILYGRELFSAFPHLQCPRGILPIDIADMQTRAGYDELGATVFLYLVGDLGAV